MRMNSEFASAEIVTTRELMMPSLGHRVPQQALHHHRSHVREQRGALPHVRKVRQHEFMQRRRCGSDAQHLARPAVDRTLELRACDVVFYVRACVRYASGEAFSGGLRDHVVPR